MDVAHPHTAVSPTLDGEVLVTLARTTRPLTGREVARLVRRGSQQGVNLALRRLVQQGLVHAQEAGPALLYTLNRDHLAAPAVEVLAGMREELVRRLREAIGQWEVAPAHASLFGSAARGDGDPESDIDIFIVRPKEVDEDDPRWRAQIDRLVADVHRWTGNHAGVAEVSARELPRLRRERPPVVADLGADAITLTDAITLSGTPPSRLLRARA